MLLDCSHAGIGHHSCGHLDESHNIVIQCKGVYSNNTQAHPMFNLPDPLAVAHLGSHTYNDM